MTDVPDGWGLRVDGDPVQGHDAVVVPVLTDDGTPAALKTQRPGHRSEHEHLALRLWDGEGAVRLLRADPERGLLLLERLSTRTLGTLPVMRACEEVAERYARLHVRASPRLPTLTRQVERWIADADDLPRDAPLPRRLVQQATSLGRELVADGAAEGVLVHGDLHDGNVLAAEREPWLVVDPEPASGDPAYEPAPVLWNRWHEALEAHDLRAHLRARFFTLVDVAGLDEERAKGWVVVRAVRRAMGAMRDDRDVVTRCITVAKAVQD